MSIPSPDVIETTALSVYEDNAGMIKLRIDGEMVAAKSELDTEKRARLLKLVIALRPWLEKAAEKKKTVTPSVRSAPIPVPTPIETPAPVKETTAATPVLTTPTENPKIQFEARAEEITVSRLSMVEQIDRILQKKLDGSPLDKQGIQLRTSISGGILIRIGLTEFEWIDEIPDEAIQLVIRESIAEWEQNATPGL